MDDKRTPWNPADPYWLLKEVAAFEREFRTKVELPMLAAMAERVDRIWDEAIAKKGGISGGTQDDRRRR